MPRTWLQIGRKEDIPIIIQACEKIKQMIGAFTEIRVFFCFLQSVQNRTAAFIQVAWRRKKLQKNYLQFAGNYGIINKINREIIHHFWMVCNFISKIYKNRK